MWEGRDGGEEGGDKEDRGERKVVRNWRMARWCDTIISQRNTVIEFLQEQAQDLTSELEDAYAYIEYLQEHPMPPDVPNQPAGDEEEDPKEIEGVSDLDSEHGDPEPEAQSNDLFLSSESSIGNLDDF